MSSRMTSADPITLSLTEAQRELLALDRIVAVPHLYNILIEAELDPELPSDALATAFAAVVKVQPALRMGLVDSPKGGGMLVAPGPETASAFRGWTVPTAEFDACRAAAFAELGATAFALDQPPLVRAVHVRAEDHTKAVLALVVHHSVFDGYSVGILLDELNAALSGGLDCETLATEREMALRDELERQLAAAATEQADMAAAALAERLRQVPSTVLYQLPARPVETEFAGKRREVQLTVEESAVVDRVCRELEISPFAYFSALHSAALARHADVESVVFGATVMTRRTPQAFDLCGYFVNTVPLVVDIHWERSFGDFACNAVLPEVERVRADSLVPLNKVARHAMPDRASNRNPIFTTLVTMQEPAEGAAGAPVRTMRQHGNDTAKFDLLLWVKPTHEGWVLEVEHDLQLLPDPVVSGYVDSLRSAIAGTAHHGRGIPLRELFCDGPVVPAREGKPRFDCDFAARVLDVADAAPAAVAIEEGRTWISYGQLAEQIRAVTGGLAERGIGPGDIVGVTTDNLPDTVVAVLAVLARRAVYLPLDLDLPAERVVDMVERARCRTVIGTGKVPGARVFGIGELRATPAEPSEDDPREHAVYAMFTSGSTGQPKGVLMANAPLANLAAWQVGTLQMGPDSRFLQYAPLGFDVSFQEIMPTLLAGGTLVSRRPVDRLDLPALARRVATTGVTHVYLPAAALGTFTQAARTAGDELPNVRFLCVAGEQVVADEGIQRFFTERPHIVLVNMYGPTETHVTTAAVFDSLSQPWPVHAPIGRPLPAVSARVVDATGHRAPCGVAGELRLGGIAPALGYVNDPDRTAERFVDGEYRTGDQVLLDASGELVYLGRKDDQVKIRGYRVELGEIEAVANALDGVRRAVAVVEPDPGRRLLLFFVPTQDSAAAEDIQAALARRLPGYMVPARVFPIDSVPTGFTGKLDRAALLRKADRAMAAEPAVSDNGAPPTPLETELRTMWEDTLRVPVTLDGSLVEAGAHSLNVLTVLSQVEYQYGVSVPVLDFFREPTIRALATLVEAERRQS
ncbi:non-ribosomal peptide synthetase [Amycolatopsis aidingensis]|uniref:non-ribosomal peptide synthetase n=1 Tax=Amycolatopsis aidingensis TaxID=2842453 RepID=UPI001C0DAC94|nr:non-ribosomal peptide synthetase [Amycolatopsis aidingensis]